MKYFCLRSYDSLNTGGRHLGDSHVVSFDHMTRLQHSDCLQCDTALVITHSVSALY